MTIDEAIPAQLYDSMPIALLQPCKRSDKQTASDTLYGAPVYKTSSRQSVTMKSGHSNNFITFFQLKTQKPVEHWVFRGAALLCQLNDWILFLNIFRYIKYFVSFLISTFDFVTIFQTLLYDWKQINSTKIWKITFSFREYF